MRCLKMFGLAAVAAAALMAFVGAGTASAETTLCTDTAGTKCASVGTELRGTSIEGAGVSKPTLTAPFGDIKCNSEIKGKVGTTTTPKGSVAAADLTWTSCEGGTAVTRTGGEMIIHHDAEHNGTVTIKNFVVTVTQAGVMCSYGGELTGTFTGGTDPIIHITAEPIVIKNDPNHPSDFFCPEKAPWHATYTVDHVGGAKTPEPLYAVTGV